MRPHFLLAGLAIAALSVASTDAHAIRRVNTENKSCAAVQDIVYSDGAAILRHTSKRIAGLPLYDRYVANDSFCQFDQVTEWSSVPTADDPTCRVKHCVRPDPVFRWKWRRFPRYYD
jgi:hypothetical protein